MLWGMAEGAARMLRRKMVVKKDFCRLWWKYSDTLFSVASGCLCLWCTCEECLTSKIRYWERVSGELPKEQWPVCAGSKWGRCKMPLRLMWCEAEGARLICHATRRHSIITRICLGNCQQDSDKGNRDWQEAFMLFSWTTPIRKVMSSKSAIQTTKYSLLIGLWSSNPCMDHGSVALTTILASWWRGASNKSGKVLSTS